MRQSSPATSNATGLQSRGSASRASTCQLHSLVDGAAAVETALRLERSNAYDAAYRRPR